MKTKNKKQSLRARIHAFMEEPKGFWAWYTQGIIFLMIFLSVALVIVETFYPTLYINHLAVFERLNIFILGVFTIEYFIRILSAAQRMRFAVRPMSVIDFVAVFPNYLEFILPLFIDTTSVRVLRLLRPIRLLRVLRAFKIFRYSSFIAKTFHYQGTILQMITPVLLLFAAIKGGVWMLEHAGYWTPIATLGELMTIIGFALGIVLSQKIASTHQKYVQVEAASVRLYGSLRAMTSVLNNTKKGQGTRLVRTWAKKYLLVLDTPKADNYTLAAASAPLYRAVAAGEPGTSTTFLTELYTEIQRDAAFCLSQKIRLTPKAYDTLLHQSTLLYLLMLTVFISGGTGMIATLLATYILYGMYYLTQDLDSIISDDYTLTHVDLSELKRLAGMR